MLLLCSTLFNGSVTCRPRPKFHKGVSRPPEALAARFLLTPNRVLPCSLLTTSYKVGCYMSQTSACLELTPYLLSPHLANMSRGHFCQEAFPSSLGQVLNVMDGNDHAWDWELFGKCPHSYHSAWHRRYFINACGPVRTTHHCFRSLQCWQFAFGLMPTNISSVDNDPGRTVYE